MPSRNLAPRIIGMLSLLLTAGFLYFVYLYLPQKVAESIVEKSKIHKPLTTTPRAAEFAYQDVSFKTQDGVSISGWWLPPDRNKKPLGTILMSHGIFKNREQVLSRAELLAAKGYQVLLF